MLPEPFHITVPGAMIGKGRPKFSSRSGFARAYTPAKTANMETWVKSCAIEQVGQPVLCGPLRVALCIGVPVPKSWPKHQQAAALQQTRMPTGKPDADNCIKLICDALNEIVWKDDAQIVELSVRKFYAAIPATEITVTPL